MSEKTEDVYVTVKMNDGGKVSIDTNLSAIGAIHLIATATQIVIEQQANKQEEEVVEESKIIEQ